MTQPAIDTKQQLEHGATAHRHGFQGVGAKADCNRAAALLAPS